MPFLAPGDLERVPASPTTASRSPTRSSPRSRCCARRCCPGLLKAVAYNAAHRQHRRRACSRSATCSAGRPTPAPTLPDEREHARRRRSAGAEAPAAVAACGGRWPSASRVDAELRRRRRGARAAPDPRGARSSSAATSVGAVGEVDPGVLDAYGIDERVAWLEVDLGRAARPAARRARRTAPFSRYPVERRRPRLRGRRRRARRRRSSAAIARRRRRAAGRRSRLFDVYRGAGVADGRRSLAYRAAAPGARPHAHRRRGGRGAAAALHRRRRGRRCRPRSVADAGPPRLRPSADRACAARAVATLLGRRRRRRVGAARWRRAPGERSGASTGRRRRASPRSSTSRRSTACAVWRSAPCSCPPRPPAGGFLGVDLFFALSGFLITSLLVAERRAPGRHRPRRLLGAAGPAAAARAAGPRGRRGGAADDAHGRPPIARASAATRWPRWATSPTGSAWRPPVSYWDIFGQPSPLDHTWSLAIEEQFYLVWPLVALVPRRLAPAPAGGARSAQRAPASARRRLGRGGSACSRWRWHRVARRAGRAVVAGRHEPAYFGTDARLGPTLLGAALATVMAPAAAGPGRRRRRSTWPAVALGGMAVAFLVIDGQGASYYRGGLVGVHRGGAGADRGRDGRAAGPVGARPVVAPLVALGAISYGVYLWHWPVIVYLTPERLGVRRIVAQACACWSRWPWRSARTASSSGRSGGARCGAGRWSPRPRRSSCSVPWSSRHGGRQPRSTARPVTAGRAGRRSACQFEPTTSPAGATRLLLVGDSGPSSSASSWRPRPPDRRPFAIGMSSALDCPPALLGTQVRYAGGDRRPRAVPDERRRRWAAWRGRAGRRGRHYVANAGGLGEQWLDGEWVTDCDPAFDAAGPSSRPTSTRSPRPGRPSCWPSSPDVPLHADVARRDRVPERHVPTGGRAHPGTLVIDLRRLPRRGRRVPGEPCCATSST